MTAGQRYGQHHKRRMADIAATTPARSMRRSFVAADGGFAWASELARNVHIERHEGRLGKHTIAKRLGVSWRTVIAILAA